MRKLLLWYFLFILLVSCKVNKVSQVQSSPFTDQILSEDPPIVLTDIPKDTTITYQDSVELNIHKVVREKILLSAVGDIMMGTNYPTIDLLPKENGEYLWKAAESFLKETDITFGNLEGVLLSGEGEPKECKNPDHCYLFKTPEEYAFHFKEKGFDLLSLANNHANDFGKTGRKNTQKVLDSLKIKHAGSQETPYCILKEKGIVIGLVAISPNSGTLNLHDEKRWISYVELLDSLTDFVIFSFHGGAEGAKYQSVPRKTEYYVGENRGNVYEIAHKAIDAGADVVIGHGPHVVRGIEIYKNRLISYSLGNFLTFGRFNLQGQNGLAPLLLVKTTSNGEFLEGKIISFKQSKILGLQIDETQQAAKKIRELSQMDFPENAIDIDESGRIFYIEPRN